ncbi:hypothetical protein ABLA30_03955 [Xenorhabdus nematophila]|uniref:hypothetical protein n=1 Tax=Xenorhabdus nematophila TaxID=628 RepID=UPI0032B81CC7
MMIKTPLIMMSSSFRAKIIKIWIIRTSLSAAQGAAQLNEVAVKHGFVRRDKPVFGTTLTSWTLGQQLPPLWATQAALQMLIESDWTPSNDEEWAGFATIFLTMSKSTQLADLINELPLRFASHVATSGWLCAAIEENERYKVFKQYEKK